MFIWAALNPRECFRSITYARALELSKGFSATLDTVPLASYQMCLANTQQAFTLVQMTLSLVFGRFFVILPASRSSN